MSHYGLIRRPIHRSHSRTVVLFCESRKEHFDGYRSDTRLEIEQAKFVDTHPISNIFRICQSCRQADKSDIVASLLGYVAHSTYDYLDYRATLLTEQMNLVNNDQSHS